MPRPEVLEEAQALPREVDADESDDAKSAIREISLAVGSDAGGEKQRSQNGHDIIALS